MCHLDTLYGLALYLFISLLMFRVMGFCSVDTLVSHRDLVMPSLGLLFLVLAAVSTLKLGAAGRWKV
ncbi:hypothetical protein BHE90_003457 [Fusarium euwallaceae]|uniref:Uncharacterized protein n=2 Tax=Fusarium solani species complex TaxID=232080 RepID=A0A428TFA2_9HYPO|nr:hypothetical protein CEP52_008937 [Fusarium oligoseptatum]RTE81986.1 hypothetical protein BHE90_003457 [Fusarium euwallaceae]